jgi:hypothetical protein
MGPRMKLSTVILLGAAAMGSACSIFEGPGFVENALPPRLVSKDGVVSWDRVNHFGPVPASLAAAGAQACGTLNTKELKFFALGYHSRALGLNGRTLPGGGFYCVQA